MNLNKPTAIIHKISEENPNYDVMWGGEKHTWRSGQDGGSPLHDEILEAG